MTPYKIFTTISLMCTLLPSAYPQTQSSEKRGAVRVVVRTDPSWDKYTKSPPPRQQEWFRRYVWRMVVFSPYFDKETAWYPNAWVYRDLYGAHLDNAIVKQHRDWILKDSAGNPLYIPWGCSNGTCPQYALDPGNPEFVKWWVSDARQVLKHGYKGLWIDDVNLEFRVGNGKGEQSIPNDPRTGKAMTIQAWKQYVASFTEAVRTALPQTEIVHNAIWFTGGKNRYEDKDIRREIRAASYINCERGVVDPGLTGGSGDFSLSAFLTYVDHVHKLGRAVVFDNDPGRLNYALASYFLASSGEDGFGSKELRPDRWWSGVETDLGSATGPRQSWNGLLCRNFERGIVLVNPPQTASRRIALLQSLARPGGDRESALTIGAAEGFVLLSDPNRPVTAEAVIRVSAPGH